MTRTVAVIQARLGSRRFPDKMLAELGGQALLEWVVLRVRQSRSIDRVVVATTLETLDDRIVAECRRLGVDVARGSTNDVLSRFIEALQGDDADTVVRICADNPFVDAGCIETVLREHASARADYSFNHRPSGACDYADGFGVEVVSRPFLDELNTRDLSASHREHVTLAIADGTVLARVHACIAPTLLARPELRFDVDEPADFHRLQTLVSLAGLHVGSAAAEVVAANDRHGAAF